MTSLLRGYGMSFGAHEKPTVGDIKYSAAAESHLGWLKCDGSELNIADYKFLYYVIGTSFGTPSAPTKFKLPNPAALVPTAVGSHTDVNDDTRTFALGDISGEYRHQLTIPEMPEHTHTIDSSGAHGHNLVTNNDDFNFNSGNWPVSTSPQAGMFSASQEKDSGLMTWPNGAATNGTHAHNAQNTGDDVPHNNMQPTIAMGNMFIYSGKTLAGSYPYTKNKNLW